MKDWTSQLDEITKQFMINFDGVSVEQLNWKSSPQTWSIAQNIEHLIIINESYYPILVSLHAGNYETPFIAKIGFIVSFLGNTILQSVKPDRKKKMKTFPIWEPAVGNISGDILQRYKKHQAELKNQIEASKELLNNGVVISSPANKNIVYKLETAFDIIVLHEHRHLEQAKEIVMNITKNKSR